MSTALRAALAPWVRVPGPDDHKYSRGVLGMVTGSSEYPGAALLGVQAALRTGVGMVRYAGPTEVAHLVLLNHPEVVIQPGAKDALVVGSGVADPPDQDSVARIMQAAKLRVPSVVDAGALAYVEEFGPMTVLTPHHGELASLCQRLGLVESLTDEDKATAVATMLSMTVLVKGSITAVVDPTGAVLRLPPATPWLATAGTGDVLAGILGALFAGSHATLTEHPELLPHAVYAGALLHQEAARRASDRLAGAGGTPGAPITASDVCEELPGLIAEVLR